MDRSPISIQCLLFNDGDRERKGSFDINLKTGIVARKEDMKKGDYVIGEGYNFSKRSNSKRMLLIESKFKTYYHEGKKIIFIWNTESPYEMYSCRSGLVSANNARVINEGGEGLEGLIDFIGASNDKLYFSQMKMETKQGMLSSIGASQGCVSIELESQNCCFALIGSKVIYFDRKDWSLKIWCLETRQVLRSKKSPKLLNRLKGLFHAQRSIIAVADQLGKKGSSLTLIDVKSLTTKHTIDISIISDVFRSFSRPLFILGGQEYYGYIGGKDLLENYREVRFLTVKGEKMESIVIPVKEISGVENLRILFSTKPSSSSLELYLSDSIYGGVYLIKLKY